MPRTRSVQNIARRGAAFTGTLLSGLLFLGLSAQPAAADTTLRVGSDLTYPPYTYTENNLPAGFDPEFIHLISQQMQVTPAFEDTRFANLIMGVNASRFDVIASALYVTPERAAQVEFIPYFETGSSIVVRTDNDSAPKTAEDLCGLKVGSIQGASWLPKLQDVSDNYCVPKGLEPIESREFPTSPEAAQALMSNAIDAQFEDAAVAQILSTKLQGRVQISSQKLLYPVVVGLAVKRGNTELKQQIEAAITAIRENGQYASLLAKYNLAAPAPEHVKAALGQ